MVWGRDEVNCGFIESLRDRSLCVQSLDWSIHL
jgi:hypothetical protein